MSSCKNVSKKITGLTDPLWDLAEVHSIDQYPWKNAVHPYSPQVQFRLLHAGQALFVRFDCREDEIRATYQKPNDPVCRDSCVEFFFQPDKSDERYLSFEINPLGAMLIGIGTGGSDITYLTDDSAHVPLAIAAMKAGKAVMTEKPVGLTLPELDELLEAQKQTGAFIQVGLELRYSKLYQKAKEVIDSGRIGTPVNYHYTYSCSPYDAGNWRVKRENSGSMYHEKLCHYIDLVRWWNGGRVSEYIVTSAPNTLPHFEIEDNVHVSCRFENGAVSQLFFLMTAAPTGNSDMLHMKTDLFDQDKDGHKLNYIITGTKGAIEIDVFQRQLRVYRHAGDPGQTATTEEVTEIYAWTAENDQDHFHNTQKQNLDILRRVACGEPPALSLEDAAETMRLCVEFSDAQLHHPWEIMTTGSAGGLKKPLRGILWFRLKAGSGNLLVLVRLLKEACLDSAAYTVTLFLFGNITLNRFLVYITNCLDIIPSRPKMPAIFVSIFRVAVKQHQCTLSLQARHHTGYAHLRRYGYIHVHMVNTYCSLKQFYTFYLTQMLQNLHYIFPYLSVHYLSTVFRDKHNMVFAIVLRM